MAVMVQTLYTDPVNNDLVINSSGSLTMLSGLPAIVAACETATQTQLGECVLETGVGLPNFTTIWVGTPDYALWQSYLQSTLLAVPGVTQVQSISLKAVNNKLSYVAEINTVYGPQTITG